MFSFASLLMALAAGACAAGPTDEEEALANFNSGRYPMVVSGDGKWLIYVDANNVLHRKSLQDAALDETIGAGGAVRALSSSQSGQSIAFVNNKNCYGVASFPEVGKSRSTTASSHEATIKWLDIHPAKNYVAAACGHDSTGVNVTSDKSAADEQNSFQNAEGQTGRIYGAFSVAISGDGKLVAIPGSPILIVNADSARVMETIPTGSQSVLNMRFIDHDRKLLVVHAQMGEFYESAPDPSDMQFAIWDRQKRELFNFYNTKTTGSLTDYDLFWSYSDASGELWAINTNGQYWSADQNSSKDSTTAMIRPDTVNLKSCGKPILHRLALPTEGQDGWLDFAADPAGRWVAVVIPWLNEKKKKAQSRLLIYDANSGKQLAKWEIESELHSLAVSNDGNTLYGLTGGQPQTKDLQLTRYAWSLSGGGVLKTFDLSAKIAGLQRNAATDWAAQHCMLEDETANARDITIDTKPLKQVSSVSLGTQQSRPWDGQAATMPCKGDDESTYHGYHDSYRTWYAAKDGTVWLDQWKYLEQINPLDGSGVKKVPTPRSDTACSLPLIDRREFLSWQGNTITLRPFADSINAADRKVLVTKPGWFAQKVELLGDRIGVRWIESKYRDEANHEIGSAIAAVYDFSGKLIKQIDGQAMNGTAYFENDGPDASDVEENVFEQFRSPAEISPYRAELSYAGSVRVRTQDAQTHVTQTVMWSGLKPGSASAADSGVTEEPGKIIDLGGSLVAYVGVHLSNASGSILDQAVDVFDAATRHRITQLRAKSITWVAWSALYKTLLIEVPVPSKPDASDPPRSELKAYVIQ